MNGIDRLIGTQLQIYLEAKDNVKVTWLWHYNNLGKIFICITNQVLIYAISNLNSKLRQYIVQKMMEKIEKPRKNLYIYDFH